MSGSDFTNRTAKRANTNDSKKRVITSLPPF